MHLDSDYVYRKKKGGSQNTSLKDNYHHQTMRKIGEHDKEDSLVSWFPTNSLFLRFGMKVFWGFSLFFFCFWVLTFKGLNIIKTILLNGILLKGSTLVVCIKLDT